MYILDINTHTLQNRKKKKKAEEKEKEKKKVDKMGPFGAKSDGILDNPR